MLPERLSWVEEAWLVAGASPEAAAGLVEAAGDGRKMESTQINIYNHQSHACYSGIKCPDWLTKTVLGAGVGPGSGAAGVL